MIEGFDTGGGWVRATRNAWELRRFRTIVGLCALSITPGLFNLAAPGAAQGELFVDRTSETGLDFTYFNGMTGELYLPEVTGGGAALLDYDGDGDLDLYLVQGQLLGPAPDSAEPVFQPPASLPLSDRLLRNDLVVSEAGRLEPRFVDVTERAGIRATGYGMGVATGDYDGDGHVDLYVTNLESNLLLRNQGDGTFADTTAEAGVDDTRWSVPATFLDFDQDGHLDLYVGNYVNFAYVRHRECPKASGAPDYCGPLAYSPVPDRLFRNLGNGRFRDVSTTSGIAARAGNGLGAVAFDADADGWTDLYVANDQMANFLWMNQGDGTFRDEALLAGMAVNRDGLAEASMGVDAADADGDGKEDLVAVHLTAETNTLYRNLGEGLFRDVSAAVGLGQPSWPYTSFGTRFLDHDNDGRLDLYVANGAVRTIEAQAREGEPYPLRQRNQLFRNVGGGRFVEVTDEAGAPFRVEEVSRGSAFGDVDGDGDVDLVQVNSAGPARLLVNQSGQEARWIGLDPGAPGAAILGTRVTLASGDTALVRRVHTDGSYASASDPRVVVGLGRNPGVERLEVEAPDGRHILWLEPPSDRYLVLPRRDRQ